MNSIIKSFEGFFKSLGVDPLLPVIFILLIMGINEIKDIKVWDKIKTSQKIWDIISWVGLVLIVIGYLVKIIRGD